MWVTCMQVSPISFVLYATKINRSCPQFLDAQCLHVCPLPSLNLKEKGTACSLATKQIISDFYLKASEQDYLPFKQLKPE